MTNPHFEPHAEHPSQPETIPAGEPIPEDLTFTPEPQPTQPLTTPQAFGLFFGALSVLSADDFNEIWIILMTAEKGAFPLFMRPSDIESLVFSRTELFEDLDNGNEIVSKVVNLFCNGSGVLEAEANAYVVSKPEFSLADLLRRARSRS